MCGLAGYWQEGGPLDLAIADKMIQRLGHRGPDDMGLWSDDQAGIALAHKRLSIMDLSSAGHQPMISPCGRYVIIFNGEIYNHIELRADLEKEGGHFDWRGHSDTETLLAALRHWGVPATLKRLIGMFAFAFWDRSEKKLYMARDRMGEKPLYYGLNNRVFLFGSELKSLAAHPRWQGEIDREALTLYLRFNYVPTPWSIYKGIKKLPPAHYVLIDDGGKNISDPICYWDLHAIADIGNSRSARDANELVDELDALLGDAVRRQMVADVPMGAFLSGGIDSSTIVALMQAQSAQPVKTFSIGFHEANFNEAKYAKAVARHLQTDHTELYVTAQDAMDVIPRIPAIWDEPFSDTSQIPTFLVSQLARKHVAVSLSGDGGDELFCGYNRYTQGYDIWSKVSLLPPVMRKWIGRILLHAAKRNPERLMEFLPQKYRMPDMNRRLNKVAEIVNSISGESFYQTLVSHWKKPGDIVLGGHEPATLLTRPELLPELDDFREVMMYLDTCTYLHDDVLAKVDRASMAVGLEARVPLLDHRVVEFSWQVPIRHKYKSGQGKWLLRQLLYRYVPQSLVDRPKMGFALPFENWLRGPLKGWAEDLLDESRIRQQGFFDPAPIRQYWDEHLSGKQQRHYYLWDILMFQAWLAENNA